MSAIMRMDDLQWRAKSIVSGFHNGLHRSPKHGFSVEFSEYRPFSVGDDPRTIDWKLYARCDRYYVKKFEDETNRRCYLVVDQSRSMSYGKLNYNKLEYARTVAATLAFYLTLQRDAVGLVTFDREIADVLPARYRPGQMKRILSMLSREGSGESTNLLDPINHLSEIVRQRSLIVVVSDFLLPVEPVFPAFSRLSARGHEIVLIQTLDPSETEWTTDKPAMVKDMETGQEIFVDPRTATASYKTRFEMHQNAWNKLANDHGMSWIPLRTDESIEIALFELLRRQQRAIQSPQRRPSPQANR
ncbi:MAG: DUF58 domain-containing protein [Pirellula sp.]|jgi:uncharacterized protein (DUF58 family)|nr:DUF58 domain-containing protein [Pirellula sp.]